MKSLLIILFVSLGLRVAAQTEFEQIAEQEMKAHGSQLKSLTSNAASNTNIIYDRLQFFIDPAINYIRGTVTTTFIPDSSINFLEFDLTDTLHVDSILFHGQLAAFTHGSNIIHVELGGYLPGGLADSIAIFYQGMPDSSGFGSFVQSVHDSVPVIWTLSEPYGARDWWPCKQDLADKIDSIDILVTCPAAYKAASNGLLVEQTTNGGNITYHWKHRYPIATYLVCMAVTNYQVFTDHVPFRGDTLSVLNYVYPESYAADTAQSKITIMAMQLYDSLFGMYPFNKEKYGQVQFGWGGGMEHQTMTFMYNYGFELVVHELGHHWFGDKVTCHSWHEIWLNEGFAVFLTTLCYKAFGPAYYLSSKQGCIGSAVKAPNGSVYCDDTTSVARIFDSHLSYAKGGVVLHQLNWMLGDSLFFAGLRSYLTDTGNAYKFGTTASLRHNLEVAGGVDLTDYFNQYVYGKGFPSYQLQWSQTYGKQVALTIGQTQSDPSVPFFQVPVPIEFKGPAGDTLMVFNPSAAGWNYTFELPFIIDTVILDPTAEILSANNTVVRQGTANFACVVYPNPASGILQAQLQSEQTGNADVKIYDLQGHIVYSATTTLQPGATFLNIDIGKLPAAVYELRVRNGKQHTTASFVVANKGR